MTDGENRNLVELRRQVEALADKVGAIDGIVRENGEMTREMHTDLYKKRPGDLKDEKPLMEAMREVVRMMNRSKWAARVISWFVGFLVAAFTLYMQLIKSGK